MQFYCLHALTDGNQEIRIREKTLEFSSTVLSTLSQYHTVNSVKALKALQVEVNRDLFILDH